MEDETTYELVEQLIEDTANGETDLEVVSNELFDLMVEDFAPTILDP